MIQDLIALFDLDSTLCSYQEQMAKDYNRIKSPQDSEYRDFQEMQPYLKERVKLIRNQPGWWRNLKPYKPGFDVLEIAIELNYQNYVLTKAPGSSVNAWSEKAEWVKDNLYPKDKNIKTIISEDKAIVYGRVLVDDYPEYIEPWLHNRKKGIVIMPAHPWNAGFSHPQVTRYDGTNLSEVREKMIWAKNRKS